MGTVRSFRPWMGYPPQIQAEPVLAEFDWDSLRRWDEDQAEHERRADESLGRLNKRLRARNLRRHLLLPVLGVALMPVAAFVAIRYAVRALA
jgi:hypothetical protein